jgi:uncharacterized membrane protein
MPDKQQRKNDHFEFSNSDWAQKLIEKCQKAFEKEETRKMIQVFIVDPIIQYVLGRIFPYIMIICVLIIILTVMTSATLMVVFMKIPGVLGPSAPS